MSVTGAFRRLAGTTDITEKNGEIIISGVSADALARDMKNIWNTSKVASAMFIKVTWTEVRIPSFFALELKFILNRLLEMRSLTTSKRVIRSIIDGINTNTWVANTVVQAQPWCDYSQLKQIVYDQLLPHQMDFLRQYEKTVRQYGLNGMLLSAAAGLGKTISDCAVALMTGATKVIIVSPKNAVYRVWQKTLNEEFKIPQHPYIYADGQPLDPSKKWHVFHYEGLDAALELARSFRGEKVCVILDECHNFNEIKSLRTERFIRLCQITNSKNIVWASGTPVKAMGFETIPLLKTIDPLFTPIAEQAFRKMFGKDAKRTLDILAHRLGLVTHITPKSDVMANKPEFETIKVAMPGADKYTLKYLAKVMADFVDERTKYYQLHYREYRELYDRCVSMHRETLVTKQQLDEFRLYQTDIQHILENGLDLKRDGDIAVRTNKYEKDRILPSIPQDLRKRFVDCKSVVKYVDLKVRGECLGRILTKERIQCHVDMIKHIDFKPIIDSIKKKTLIFTSYVKVVDATYDRMKELGYKPLRVYGENNNELVSTIRKYDSDQNANPLVTTYQSLSTAVPLTMANGIIFLNNPWRSFEKEQAIARAFRLGQDEQVYCFDVLLDTGKEVNISSRSLDIMQWSKDQVDAIMGTSGDVGLGIESNGFVVEETLDVNDAIEDVRWSTDPLEQNIVPLGEVEPEDAMMHYSPERRRFWGS